MQPARKQRAGSGRERLSSTARLREAVLVHKDPELETLAGEIALLTLPYKRAK